MAFNIAISSNPTRLGVGCHLDPPQFLTPGTNVTVYVSEIGTLKNGVAHAS